MKMVQLTARLTDQSRSFEILWWSSCMGCWTGSLRRITLPHNQLNRPFSYRSYYKGSLTESLMMVRKVLLKRIQNWVRQLAEKLWHPSVEDESCGNTWKNKLLSLQYLHSQNPTLISSMCPETSSTGRGFKFSSSPSSLKPCLLLVIYKIPLQKAGARGRDSTHSHHQHLSCSLCHISSPVLPLPAGRSGLHIHQMLLP